MHINPYPIYVISLKRTPERRLHVQRQLDALNLDYQFVDAIDSYDLKSPEYQAEVFDLLDIDGYITKYSEYIKNKSNKIGRVACTFSHMKAHKLIMKHNHSAACVLEDDVQISPDFRQILRAAQKKSWDILMLSSRSAAMGSILKKNFSIQEKIKEFPEIDCSLFPELRKMKFFRKLLPPNPTSCSVDWTVIPKLQWYWLMLSSQSQIANYLFRDFINTTGLPITSYVHCKVGGLPVRSSQQALYENYDIAIPAEAPTSGMAYLLTADTANTYKQTFARIITNNQVLIADDFWKLYRYHGVKLRIITPPCAIASKVYLKFAARRYTPEGSA